jgi:RNA polymerase sigma-70 factor (ECF subfamily)
MRTERDDVAGESSLVLRLQAGEPEAFETLVRTHSAPLLRVARRFLRDEEDARDAVQDALISAYRSIGRFDAEARLSTWLHRIVVNSSLMKLRTRRRHPEESIDDLLPHFADDGHQVPANSEWPLSADELLVRDEIRELVRRNIDELPESSRVVLLLRDIEEMSTEETAEKLGITPNAVKVRLHRARQALRARLDPHMRSIA